MFAPKGHGVRVAESAAWCFLAIALLLAVGDVVFGYWDHDGGSFLLSGAYVSQGLRPYVDYPSIYPPLNDILTGLILQLPIDRLPLAILLPLAWIAAASAATVLLAFSVTGSTPLALLLGGLFPLFAVANGGNHLTLELPVSLFTLLAMVVSLRKSLSAGTLFSAAFLASCAALSKQNGALAFLPLVAILIERRSELTRKSIPAFLGGALTPLLAVTLWVGNVAAMVRQTVTQIGSYAVQPGAGKPLTLAAEMSRSTESVLLLATGAATAIALLAVRQRPLLVCTLAGCGLLQFLPRLVRNYPHYTINVWPFLVALLALAMAVESRRLRAAARAATLAIAVFAALLVAGRARWHLPSPLLAIYAPAADRVAAVTAPNGRVHQYGSEPVIEFLADRPEANGRKALAAASDPRTFFGSPPAPESTVVLVLKGEPWIARIGEDIVGRGFVNVGVFGVSPRVAVFVHRSRLTR